MIEFNVAVPAEVKDEILSRCSDTFIIITSTRYGRESLQYFHIKADEAEIIFLKLKYGSENVWKR